MNMYVMSPFSLTFFSFSFKRLLKILVLKYA